MPVWKTIGGLAVGLLLIGQGCTATEPAKKDAGVKSKPAVEEKKDDGAMMEKKENEAMEKRYFFEIRNNKSKISG